MSADRDAAIEAAIDAAVQTKEWHAFRRPDIRNAIGAWCLAKADALRDRPATPIYDFLRREAAEHLVIQLTMPTDKPQAALTPRFSTEWERLDWERKQRGEKELGPLGSVSAPADKFPDGTLVDHLTKRADWLRSEWLNGGDRLHLQAREEECRWLAKQATQGTGPFARAAQPADAPSADIGSAEAWMETARLTQCNADYYRGLVVQIGEMLGDAAYISDDGSRQQDVLCAKVPELVAALVRKAPPSPSTAEMRRLADEVSEHQKRVKGNRRTNVWSLLGKTASSLRTAADALDAERATANATAKKWSEEWRDEYARVKDLQRQIDEALQLDGGCSTLAELINAVTKLKFDHAETEKALDAANAELAAAGRGEWKHDMEVVLGQLDAAREAAQANYLRVQHHLSYSATEANDLRAANARLEKALREIRAAYVSAGLQPTLALIDAALSKCGIEEQD